MWFCLTSLSSLHCNAKAVSLVLYTVFMVLEHSDRFYNYKPYNLSVQDTHVLKRLINKIKTVFCSDWKWKEDTFVHRMLIMTRFQLTSFYIIPCCVLICYNIIECFARIVLWNIFMLRVDCSIRLHIKVGTFAGKFKKIRSIRTLNLNSTGIFLLSIKSQNKIFCSAKY